MNMTFIKRCTILVLTLFLAPAGAVAEDTNIIFRHDQSGVADEVIKMKDFDYELLQRERDRIEQENLENSIEAVDVGDVYFEKGEIEEAISYYQIAIKMDPSNTLAHENYIEARKTERNTTNPHYHRAMEYYRQGITDKAIDELILEIKENPNNEQARIKLNEIESRSVR